MTIGTHTLKWKNYVVYLGSRFAEKGSTLSAIKHIICCAKSIFDRLNARVFCSHSVSNSLKGSFIRSAVLASLLYTLEHCAIGPRDKEMFGWFFSPLAKCVILLPYNHHI